MNQSKDRSFCFHFPPQKWWSISTSHFYNFYKPLVNVVFSLNRTGLRFLFPFVVVWGQPPVLKSAAENVAKSLTLAVSGQKGTLEAQLREDGESALMITCFWERWWWSFDGLSDASNLKRANDVTMSQMGFIHIVLLCVIYIGAHMCTKWCFYVLIILSFDLCICSMVISPVLFWRRHFPYIATETRHETIDFGTWIIAGCSFSGWSFHLCKTSTGTCCLDTQCKSCIQQKSGSPLFFWKKHQTGEVMFLFFS